jgi:hypothetical protein
VAVSFLEGAVEQKMGMQPKEGALVQLFDYLSPLVQVAPAIPIDEFWDDYDQVQTLPGAQWRALNEGFPESTGTIKTLREYVKLIGGEVKIDVELLNGPKGARTKQIQTQLKVLAAVNELQRAIFEGSESNNIREMVGMRDRIDSTQLILNATGGGALTIANFDALRDAVPFSREVRPGMKQGDGIRIVAYMNPVVYRKLDTLLKATTGPRQIQVTLDQFGRTVRMYDDVEIQVVRQSGVASTSTTQLLWYDEDPGDGTPDCTSIYMVAWSEDHCHLLYRRPSNDGRMLRVFEREQMESAPQYLLRFSGAFGFECKHPLGIARLYAITNA